jgi:hypothetical protein
VEALTERLAEDAAGAMGGLLERVRQQFEQATDMSDLAHRIHALQLPPAEFAEAMSRGMALANLVGQASLVAELGRHQVLERNAALSAPERDALPADDFAVPGKRALPIRDAEHVRLAWDMLARTAKLSDEEKTEARRRILARATKLGVDTAGWSI